MKKLIYKGKDGRTIMFDDFCDERDQDYCGVWVGMCKECAQKYHSILVTDDCDRLDPCGSGSCSVDGCGNEADYYVDFWMTDDIEIIDEEDKQ